MTIAVVWEEDERLYCAADTRIVVGNQAKTDIAVKIYSIPIVATALTRLGEKRQPHYWTQYGFVFSGSVSPAMMTAVNASTLLQMLACPQGRTSPPTFEQIAEFVYGLAKRFMEERRSFGEDGLFTAALFGWCPHASDYRVALLDGRDDAGNFRVELHYLPRPETSSDPWVVLGAGTSTFNAKLSEYKKSGGPITKRVPRRVVDQMVAEEAHETVGGATALGVAYPHGFELVFALEPVVLGQPEARRVLNGLDMDTELSMVGPYVVAAWGLA